MKLIPKDGSKPALLVAHFQSRVHCWDPKGKDAHTTGATAKRIATGLKRAYGICVFGVAVPVTTISGSREMRINILGVVFGFRDGRVSLPWCRRTLVGGSHCGQGQLRRWVSHVDGYTGAFGSALIDRSTLEEPRYTSLPCCDTYYLVEEACHRRKTSLSDNSVDDIPKALSV